MFVLETSKWYIVWYIIIMRNEKLNRIGLHLRYTIGSLFLYFIYILTAVVQRKCNSTNRRNLRFYITLTLLIVSRTLRYKSECLQLLISAFVSWASCSFSRSGMINLIFIRKVFEKYIHSYVLNENETLF